MSSGYIYGMGLKNDPYIRYIGMTTKSIEKRLMEHKKASRHGRKYPVYDWIRKHGEENVVIFLIEYVEKNLEDREVFWINRYKDLGHNLLNLTEGGSGPNGHVWTEEQRSKHSKKMKEVANRPEVKEKIRKNRKTTKYY